MELNKKDNESKFDFHKRLIYGKLIDKTLLDEDYTELSKLVYDKEYSSDVARRMMYGSRYTLELFENEQVENTILNTNDIEKELAKNYKNVVELNKDGSQTSDKLLQMSEEQCKDVIYLLKSHGYDIKSWELVSARNNIWNSYSKTDGVMTLYSSKITVKPKQTPTLDKEQLKNILDDLIINYKIPQIIKTDYNKNGDLLVVNMADLHFGLKAYLETSNNLYDNEIASSRFIYLISDVINRIHNKNIKKIILINSGDLCNFDTPYQTTKGTPQPDATTNYYSMFKEVSKLMIQGIDMLLDIAPVEVWNCNSNHDRYTTFGIFQTLEYCYRNNSNVYIDTETLDRKYIKFGKSLIGLSHNIDEKKAYKIIHSEAKQHISESNYIYWFVAHLHKSMVIDDYGVEIRRLPTGSGDSEWSYQQGYCGTIKKWESYIIDEQYGITDILNTVIK